VTGCAGTSRGNCTIRQSKRSKERSSGLWRGPARHCELPVRRRIARLQDTDTGMGGASLGEAASSSRKILIRAAITEMTTGPIKMPINPNT
jgi:hypothetical protein